MHTIWRDAEFGFFHSARGDLPRLFCVSLVIVFIIVLYNSYSRNEIGSYLARHWLKSNTIFFICFYSPLRVNHKSPLKLITFEVI